jgi:hypothetical protein
MGIPQNPSDPFPGPPFPLPNPDEPADPDEDEPQPEPQTSLARDPRADPQQGDQLRGDGHTRHVLKRDGAMLLISGGMTRYWMRVDRWQRWCEKSGAETAAKDGR